MLFVTGDQYPRLSVHGGFNDEIISGICLDQPKLAARLVHIGDFGDSAGQPDDILAGHFEFRFKNTFDFVQNYARCYDDELSFQRELHHARRCTSKHDAADPYVGVEADTHD